MYDVFKQIDCRFMALSTVSLNKVIRFVKTGLISFPQMVTDFDLSPKKVVSK